MANSRQLISFKQLNAQQLRHVDCNWLYNYLYMMKKNSIPPKIQLHFSAAGNFYIYTGVITLRPPHLRTPPQFSSQTPVLALTIC